MCKCVELYLQALICLHSMVPVHGDLVSVGGLTVLKKIFDSMKNIQLITFWHSTLFNNEITLAFNNKNVFFNSRIICMLVLYILFNLPMKIVFSTLQFICLSL
jgi:hypothetical protein